MKVEHLLYAGSSCAAVASALWAVHLYIDGPQPVEGIAFSEYSTIESPLFRPRDVTGHIPEGREQRLITGSVTRSPEPSKKSPAVLDGFKIIGIYDHVGLVEDDDGKLWAVVPGSNLPGLGVVHTIKNRGDSWVVTGQSGSIISKAR